ncbi:MAG: hypothetical protein HZB09_00260 [Candidatus Yonathbacteria bacterium]|nr:hypothetical protein [Candidatus Yonathbacteria bacterium]
MNRKIIVVGLTGQLGAGKGVISNILTKEHGFTHYSLSDRVREIATSQERGPKNGLTGRESLQNVGNETRAWFGGDSLAKLTAGHALIDLIAGKDRIVFDSIRNPEEILFLKKIPGFKLVAVIASREQRFKNILNLNRPADPKTFEDFCRCDDRDLGIGENTLGQNVGKCIEMADIKLINESTRDDLGLAICDLVYDLAGFVGETQHKSAKC